MSLLTLIEGTRKMDESRTISVSARLTTAIAFLRVLSWEFGERVRRWAHSFFSSLSRPQRIVLRISVTACFAFLFAYSWTHSGPPKYQLSGKRVISWTPLLGVAFFASLVSLLLELSGRE
jgi:hypothetical protein